MKPFISSIESGIGESQRSGLNTAASSPQISVAKFIVMMGMTKVSPAWTTRLVICLPFLSVTGWESGIESSFLAARIVVADKGFDQLAQLSKFAIIRTDWRADTQNLFLYNISADICVDSSARTVTASRYGMLLSSSAVNSSEDDFDLASRTSARNLLCTSGDCASCSRVQVSAVW